MSWLSSLADNLDVHIDSHTLGNLAKNLAPAVAFTPLGVLGAGALAAGGEFARGGNVKSALTSGLENAGIGGGLAAAAGGLGIGSGARIGFGIGQGAAGGAGAASTAAPSASVAPAAGSGFDESAVTGLNASSGGLATTGQSVGSRLAALPGQALSFAEAHPNAAAGTLQGIGAIANRGAQNNLLNAQTAATQAQATDTSDQAALSAYQLQQLKNRDAALQPIFASALNGAGPRPGVRADPYATNPYVPANAGG